MRPPRAALLVALFAAGALAAQQEQPGIVRGLSFEGNHALDDYTLSTAIATSNSSWFARASLIRVFGLGEKRQFNEVEFRRDVIRLLLLYRQSGYMNAIIDTTVRREDHDVYIAFHIFEGEPVRLAKLDLLGLAGLGDVAALKRNLPLQVGSPFNRLLLQASADTVVSWLKNRGYPFAEVLRNFDVDVPALRAEATLEAVPGPRVRIGSVTIVGAAPGDTATVRRMLSVKAGEWFRADQLYQTQRDLYGLGMFRSVNVALADTVAPSAGDSTVPVVVVRVSDAPHHQIRVGGGYGSLDCFRFQTRWTAYDFLGGARTLDLTGQLSKIGVGFPTDVGLRSNVCAFLQGDSTSDTANYNATVTLRQPGFLAPSHAASLALYAERRSEFKVYTRQAVGANLALTLNARRAVPVTLGYSYSVGRTAAAPVIYCSVFRVCDASDQAFLSERRRFGAVTAAAVAGQVNSVLDPSAGSLLNASVAYASRYLLSSSPYEFSREELAFSQYYPLGRRSVLAWRVRGGVILAQGINLSGQGAHFVPPDQRFYAGGPNSVRGYTLNELGPRVYVTDSVIIRGPDTTYRDLTASPTGGNTVFTANLELRLATPIFPERMRLGLFVDVGQVWERGDTLSPISGVRVTPGLGLRFVTPLGPVRLDAAYNDYPPEPGPLYLENTSQKPPTLTVYRTSIKPARPASFWQRVTVQFAVGQAF